MAETLSVRAAEQTPVVEIIQFEGGAHFLAAQGLSPEQVRLANIARRCAFKALPVTGVKNYYFAQVTDTMLGTIERFIDMGPIPVVDKTPEDLVGEGFDAHAIIAGLKSAVVLAPT